MSAQCLWIGFALMAFGGWLLSEASRSNKACERSYSTRTASLVVNLTAWGGIVLVLGIIVFGVGLPGRDSEPVEHAAQLPTGAQRNASPLTDDTGGK